MKALAPIYSVEDVSIDLSSEGRSRQILQNISMTVERGSVVGIVGRSGTGKTTLLRALGGLIPVTTGRLLLDDRPLSGPPEGVVTVFTLPATAPHIAVGARLSIITALIVTIVTEMLVSPHGLGWRLTSAQQALEYDQMWAAVIASGVIGLVLNLLLVAAINRMPGSGGRR